MATNTETYIFQQMFARPVDAVYPAPDSPGLIASVILEEYKSDGTIVAITKPCPTTGQIRVTTTFTNTVRVSSITAEVLPYNGGNTFNATADCAPGTVCNMTPVTSDLIYNISPAFSTTTSVQYDVNYPLIAHLNNFELLLHHNLLPV